MINDTVGKGDTERRLCCLCLRPMQGGLTADLAARYMGREMGLRDVWAHTSCYNARYHGQVGLSGKQEPQEKQSKMEMEV